MNYLKNSLFYCLLISALVFQACSDDDGDEGPSPNLEVGSFEATMTGDVSQELTGEAYFLHTIDVGVDPPVSSLQIDMSPADASEFLSIRINLRNDDNGVEPGIYDVQDPDNFITITYTSVDDVVYFASAVGTIEIVEFEGELMWGSFSAELVEINDGTIQIDGEFNADEY